LFEGVAVVEIGMGKDTPETARQRGEMAVRGLRDLQPVVFSAHIL
jgi:hypothetical protein